MEFIITLLIFWTLAFGKEVRITSERLLKWDLFDLEVRRYLALALVGVLVAYLSVMGDRMEMECWKIGVAMFCGAVSIIFMLLQTEVFLERKTMNLVSGLIYHLAFVLCVMFNGFGRILDSLICH